MYIYIYIYIYVYTHICICVYIYIYIYVYYLEIMGSIQVDACLCGVIFSIKGSPKFMSMVLQIPSGSAHTWLQSLGPVSQIEHLKAWGELPLMVSWSHLKNTQLRTVRYESSEVQSSKRRARCANPGIVARLDLETRGKILHTRNRHLRNHRGCSVAFTNIFSVASSNTISLVSVIVQRIVTRPVDYAGNVSNALSVAFSDVISLLRDLVCDIIFPRNTHHESTAPSGSWSVSPDGHLKNSPQSYVGKGVWRQGISSSVRTPVSQHYALSSYAYLCTSDHPARLGPLTQPM